LDTNQNWYRQMLALVLLSASKAAVEFLTNPSSRDEAVGQLRGAFAEIDYDSLASALTRAINEAADNSKGVVNEAIDTLRERGVEAVDDAKSRAEKQLAPKKSHTGMKLFFGLIFGAVLGYFLLDEQRRDELLDRLTGASGPIQQTAQSFGQQSSSTTGQAPPTAADTTTTPTENPTGQNTSA